MNSMKLYGGSRGISWSVFYQGVHLGDYYTREAGEIVQTFVSDIDIFSHRIELL